MATPIRPHAKLTMGELFGTSPLKRSAAQAWMVLRGDASTPASRFDRSSLKIFTPRLGIATWRGHKAADRILPIANLFNHRPTPSAEGWSVRVTQVEDFRGKELTYDSHNGTDFVIPPGTLTTAAADGQVVAIRREFNRGGLKVYLHHGEGLLTSHNHLGRSLVSVGERVRAGQAIAITGYSGMDGLSTFPWVAPHVHWNVILGGKLVDPFARHAEPSEVSLWLRHNDPRPVQAIAPQLIAPQARFEPARIERLLEAMVDTTRRDALLAAHSSREHTPSLLPFALLIEATIYPTRFSVEDAGTLLYPEPPARSPRLALPFRKEDYDAIGFADTLGYR